MPTIPEWKRPERPSMVLRLWGGDPTVPAVYVATANPDGPGYLTRRYLPGLDDAPNPEFVATVLATAAEANEA